MKSLSLARPLVITVIGLPGSGKSFFARQFADTFSAPLVSNDYIRKNMFKTMTYSAKEDAAVMGIASEQIKQLLKTNKTFVVDGGMNARVTRAGLEKLARTHGYGTLTIWVQTDEPTSRMRSLKRSDKRKGDELNIPMTDGSFMRYKRQLTTPTGTENVVVISGKHTFASQAKMVLQKLVAPREASIPHAQHPIAINPENTSEQSRDVQSRRHNVIIN